MYVKRDEQNCNCGCGMQVDYRVWMIANIVRMRTGRPYISNSGARCLAWNRHEGSSDTSSHVKGLADDVHYFDNQHKLAIIDALRGCGVTRIGINENKTFVHWDLDEDKPQNTLFGY